MKIYDNNYYVDFFRDVLVKNQYMKTAKLSVRTTASGYDSILISMPGNAYWENRKEMLFARIKNNGKERYIEFKVCNLDWFVKHDIPVKQLKLYTDYFRLMLENFDILEAQPKEEVAELVKDMVVNTMRFEPFGCCGKYVECSVQKRCLHTDPLYSTACMYRKNLENGKIFYSKMGGDRMPTVREFKGNSIIDFPDNYCAIDIETTGYSPEWNEIIELAAVRVENKKVVDTYSSLIKPDNPVDGYTEELTGITNGMLVNAPSIQNELPNFLKFVGDNLILGHNVSFDVNFIYDNCNRYGFKAFSNDFVDNLRISRKLHPELEHHRLQDIVEYYNIENIKNFHRALDDSYSVMQCFEKAREEVNNVYGNDDFKLLFKKNKVQYTRNYINLENLIPLIVEPNEECPLYGKTCVFTGKLEKMTRADAQCIVEKLGGVCGKGVTAKTDFLILGNNDYCKSIKDGKSSKYKKAEALKLMGSNIEVIPENVFYDMIFE